MHCDFSYHKIQGKPRQQFRLRCCFPVPTANGSPASTIASTIGFPPKKNQLPIFVVSSGVDLYVLKTNRYVGREDFEYLLKLRLIAYSI